MAFQSMTGTASVEGGDSSLAWTWNARSVNGRGLDVRCRVPRGFERLESAAREQAARRMARGSIQLSLELRPGARREVTVNRDVLGTLEDLVRERSGAIDPAAMACLLQVPGVIGAPADSNGDGMLGELEEGLGAVLDGLAGERTREGAHLLDVIGGLLDEIDASIAVAHREARSQPEEIRRMLDERLEGLIGNGAPIDDERLAQEVVLHAARADVREELDRLAVHAAAARGLLSGEGEKGRRLGFLCQELLREANTLCSKSCSSGLTAAGLDLKVAIDRLREQVQNVE